MTNLADATRLFQHGTRAGLPPGGLLAPGFATHYAGRKVAFAADPFAVTG